MLIPVIDKELIPLVIESLLFVSSEPVAVDDLRKTLGLEKGPLDEALQELSESWSRRGIRLQRLDGHVQLVTAPEAAPYVERFLGQQTSTRLSSAALETLAIVAYQQPVTRQRVEAIRGVDSGSALGTLQTRGLVEEVGRLEAVGRPILYGTTIAFLSYFGLQSLEELPKVDIKAPPVETP
ncbi:MAG: SMC-Scp complex subunit ScpB [Chloroflexi bacterium]|nr:SMC-Scp complex subunit ScpB [Chloroflexota bacterium]